jgi:ADP-heptose:LPS heptosyltransferase
MRLTGVEKIAVLRAGGIGDLIFALPALEALRAAYPHANIALLGTKHHVDLLRGRSSPVDRVIPVPPCHGVNMRDGPENSRSLASFIAEMREEHFDLALQLHGGGRYSNPFLLELGARVTAGLRASDAPPLDRSMPYYYWQPEIARYLEAVSLVGARPVTITPRLRLMQRDIAESEDAVPESDTPLVLLNVGASDGRRRWPPERFAAVGDALAERGATILLNGSRAERELNQQVASRMHSPCTDLSGRLSLRGLLGLAWRCALMVSNDTGPLHMAGAVGAPTVGIYWCGNMVNGGGALTRTRHRPCISWQLRCPVCGVDCFHGQCDHHASFVGDVTVAEVLDACYSLLESTVNYGGQEAGFRGRKEEAESRKQGPRRYQEPETRDQDLPREPVIPAQAGTHLTVIPAQAGTHVSAPGSPLSRE